MLRRASDPVVRGPPARDASVSRRRTTAGARRSLRRTRGRGGGFRLLRQTFLVRLLHVLIAPVDDGLRPQLDTILLELLHPLIGEHALADLIARPVELENPGRRRGLEL